MPDKVLSEKAGEILKGFFPSVNDQAMTEDKNTGGIDLTPAVMDLHTQNTGEAIKFRLDPGILRQLQNAPGFVPVIINIRPMNDLHRFLGINDAMPR